MPNMHWVVCEAASSEDEVDPQSNKRDQKVRKCVCKVELGAKNIAML